MQGGGDPRRMSIDREPRSQSINSRHLVASDPTALNISGQRSPLSADMQNGAHNLQKEPILGRSKKLQDHLQEMGQKIKHHEQNANYLKSLKNKLEDSILDMQVALGKYHKSFSVTENEEPIHVKSEEQILECILMHEKSAAALVFRIKCLGDTQATDHSLTKDVLGVVAKLGTVEDDNLSRLLSKYLGLETMLAIVCKTYEGVKTLESYHKDGSVNTSSGFHAFAASIDNPLDDQFLVICLENLRPYVGDYIADDPQRRLDLQKPRLQTGETPHGFLGFAVNMITIDSTNLYCSPETGYTLRDTLFYNLFSNMQVYRSREDMLKALPCITHGAISLDGGVLRSPAIFSLGLHRGDIGVKFPTGSQKLNFPEKYFETENQMKDAKWKKARAIDDLQREQALLDHAKLNYEVKKREFVQYLAETSSFANMAARASTLR